MRDDLYNEGFRPARGATASPSDHVAPCDAQVAVARLQLAEFERALRRHAERLTDLPDLLEGTRVLHEQLDRDRPSEVVVQGVLDRLAVTVAPVAGLSVAVGTLARSFRRVVP